MLQQHSKEQWIKGCEDFARGYIDDLVIFSSSWEEHLQHLRDVFVWLQRAGLLVNVAKCQGGILS